MAVEYIGYGTEADFIAEMAKKTHSSVGRIGILLRVISRAGQRRLFAMDENELRRFWDGEVVRRPADFELNGGAFTGLSCSPTSDDHHFCDPETRRITDHGLSMFRRLLRYFEEAAPTNL